MRRGKRLIPRCNTCHLLVPYCICDQINKMQLQTHICLVLHRREATKTTNTGSLAVNCLSNSSVLIQGQKDAPLKVPSRAAPQFNPLMLFPSSSAEILSAKHMEAGPITLFVPDGTWNQATRMRRRLPWLSKLKTVALGQGPKSRYRLRATDRDGGLATAEAIARALGILEGQEVQREIERVFQLMVNNTLRSRGTLG